jgi:hypothetical protein
MSLQQDILMKFVDQGTRAWTNIEFSKTKKTSILNQIKKGLSTMASPLEENQVKIDIIRESCKRIGERYPRFSNEARQILTQFENHLKFDQVAVLPFSQLDKLTFRIFLCESLRSAGIPKA